MLVVFSVSSLLVLVASRKHTLWWVRHKAAQDVLSAAMCCQTVIDFFNSRLDSIKGNSAAAPEGQASWNVGRVLELVQTFAQVRRRSYRNNYSHWQCL
jgi:hypothetical protein